MLSQRNNTCGNKSGQECIPVGCVPTTAVTTTRCQFGGCLPTEGCLPAGGDLPTEGGLPTTQPPPPSPCEQNDTCF